MSSWQVGPKRRRMDEENDILGPVKRQEVMEATLVQRLTEYVERIDTDMVRLPFTYPTSNAKLTVFQENGGGPPAGATCLCIKESVT